MSDIDIRGRDSRGVQAYRLVMLACMASLGFLLTKTYEKMDKTADTMGSVERSITALNGRMDAQADRLAAHDRRFERIEDRVFVNTMPLPRMP
jgi:hypothetical protein